MTRFLVWAFLWFDAAVLLLLDAYALPAPDLVRVVAMVLAVQVMMIWLLSLSDRSLD